MLPYEIIQIILKYYLLLRPVNQKNLFAILISNKTMNINLTDAIHTKTKKNIKWFVSKYCNICIECNKKTKDTIENRFNMKICTKCLKPQLISLTSAKKTYYLNDIQLKSLEHVSFKNMFRSSTYITMYLESQVKQLSEKLLGTEYKKEKKEKKEKTSKTRSDNLILHKERQTELFNLVQNKYNKQLNIFKIQCDLDFQKYVKKGIPKVEKRKDILVNTLIERLNNGIIDKLYNESNNSYDRYDRYNNRYDTYLNYSDSDSDESIYEYGYENRREHLKNKLKNVNLILRNDSTLCNNYIKYNNGNLQEIVDIMVEMDWFFKNTTYEQDRYINGYLDSEYGKKISIKKYIKNNGVQSIPESLIRYI